MIETIISDNKISQIAVAKNIVQKYCFNLNKYIGRNTPTLFYGICDSNDLNLILNHRGKKIIFFDVNFVKKNLDYILIKLGSSQIINNLIDEILCDNYETETLLNEKSILVKNINSGVDNYSNNSESFEETLVEDKLVANEPSIVKVDMASFEEKLNEKKKNSQIARNYDTYVKEISNDQIPKNELFNKFMESYEKFHESNKLNEEKYFEFISTQESSINESIEDFSNDNESVNSNQSIHSEDDLNINYETKEEVTKNISTLKL